MDIDISYTPLLALPLKMVLFSRIDPGTISTLERDHDLRLIFRTGSAIESQAEIGGRILESLMRTLQEPFQTW